MSEEIPAPSLEEIEAGKINPDLRKRATRNPGGRDNDDNPTRAMSVVALKVAGASFATIAEELGYASPTRAREVYERALAESVDEDTDLVRARALQNTRLDRLLMSVWPKANNSKHPDHLAYVRTALALIDRKNKMNGYDMPVQVDVRHTAAIEEIEAWAVQAAAQITGSEQQPEASIFDDDIIDAEVVE